MTYKNGRGVNAPWLRPMPPAPPPPPVKDSSRGTDAQILKERELTSLAIQGAIAYGQLGKQEPPDDSAWLRPFYDIGKQLAASPAPASAAPSGWKLVPIEPTDDMVRAAVHLDLSYMPGHEGPDRACVYRAMLAATPSSV